MNIMQVDFFLEAQTKVVLQEWKGSALRGALGESLKRAYCIFPKRFSCYRCKNGDVCPYGYLYETQPKKSSEKFSANRQVTKPIAIEPPLDNQTLFNPGDKIAFKINFFGKSKKYLPDIENALKELKFLGRFRNRGFGAVKYAGKEVKKISLETPREDFNKVKMFFLSPTQLVFEGAVISEFSFLHIIKNLSRKHSAISQFHEEKIEKINWVEVFEDAALAETTLSNLEYNIIETYSSKEKKVRRTLGFTGTSEFDLSQVQKKKIVHYLLEFGKYCHLGKFASFGYGMYNFTLT